VSETPIRVHNLDDGAAMVITDLHGDYDAYCRYRDRFFQLHAEGRADFLIFCGDLIHAEGTGGPDGSLAIVRDILALEERLGDRLIYLLGNHELPHIYSFALAKGDQVLTSAFEQAMGKRSRRAS
jgi:hypothetical protein